MGFLNMAKTYLSQYCEQGRESCLNSRHKAAPNNFFFFFFLSIFNCCGQNITRTTSMSAAHNIAASSFSKLISGGSQHITSTYHGVTPTPPHQPEAFIQILQQLDSSNVNLSAPRYLRFKCLSMAIVLLTSSASTQLI